MNLLYIRALILPTEVLFFDSAEGPESKLHNVFMAKLQVRPFSRELAPQANFKV